MSKTLKTYPDGSEFTTTHVAVLAVGTAVYVGGLAFVMERRERRNMRKQSDKIVKTLTEN